MYSQLIEFIVDRARTVLVLMGIVTLGAVALVPGIHFDFSPEKVYEGSGDWVDFLEEHRTRFRHEDAVMLLVLQGNGEDDVLDPAALTWLSKIADATKKVTHVRTVESLATLQIPRKSLSNRGIRTSPLIDEIPVTADAAEMIRDRVDDFELLNDTLLSSDRRFAVTMVILNPEDRDMDSMREAVRGVELAMESTPVPPGYQLHMTGVPSIRVGIVRSLQADQLFMFPAAGALFLLVMWILFRSVRVTLVGLACVLCGVIWSFALIALTGLPFTLLTNVVPTLLLIIGAANSVHVASRYAEELEISGVDVRQATLITVREMSLTCALTFGTTAIGFGSLMVSNSYVLRTFSMQAAMGLVCSYFSVILFLATAFPLVHKPLIRTYKPGNSSRLVGILVTAGKLVTDRPRLIVAGSLVIVAGSVAMALQLKVNSHMFEMYEATHPTVRTINLVEEHMGGVIALEVSLVADQPGKFVEPQNYGKVAAFVDFALKQKAVTFARSYVDIYQTVYAANRGKRELKTHLPTDDETGREQLSRSVGVIEMLGDSSRIDLFLNADGRSARVLMRVKDTGSLKTNVLIDRMEQKLAQLFPKSTGIVARVTGDAYLHSRCMDRFVREMLISLLTASVIIFGVISLLFRSVRIGLISALPNITPLIITLGYMWLRGYDMTVGNVIVFAIGLGIAVDDTIHFLARFREEIRTGHSTRDAIQRTLESSGRAIVLTTILIVCGLSILLLSAFVPTRRFAELTGITMAGALLGDLLLLPACLVVFWKDKLPAAIDCVEPIGAAEVCEPLR